MKLKINHILFATTFLGCKKVKATIEPFTVLTALMQLGILTMDEKDEEAKYSNYSSADENFDDNEEPNYDFTCEFFQNSVTKFLKSQGAKIQNPYFDLNELLSLIYSTFAKHKELAIGFVAELYYKSSKFTNFEAVFTEDFLKKKEKLLIQSFEFYPAFEVAYNVLEIEEIRFKTIPQMLIDMVLVSRECCDETVKTLASKHPNFYASFDSLLSTFVSENAIELYFDRVKVLKGRRMKILKRLFKHFNPK